MSASTSTTVIATPLCICPLAFTEGKLDDGTNYTLWKFKTYAILDFYKLLDIVVGPNGANLEPVAMIDSTNPIAVIPSDATLLCAWRRRNANTLCAIVMCVSDSVLTLVQYTTNADTLIQNLENQLAAEKLVDGEKVEAFIKWIKDLQDQLAVVGVAISPKDLAQRCICILSTTKYDGPVTALNTQVCPTPLMFEELSAMLLEEEL
ncbi:hypothetical protein L7F22_017218 [Adiantum nelumboides]|nr:hypothetical protein [Adiantum nelumboides]